MPNIYNETKVGRKSVFTKQIIDDKGTIVSGRKVSLPLFQVKKNGFSYFVLYDDTMNLNKDFYEYLNFHMKENPLTTRRQSAFALRLLYCFLSLSGDNVRDIDENVLKELIAFLRGINNNKRKYDIKTTRSANTINGYLSVYRAFFSNRHIKSDALFRSHTSAAVMSYGNDFEYEIKGKTYTNNLKTSSKGTTTVPKYISPNEFRVLYQLMIENKDREVALLVHLMYGYGLRLGEALGITVEDITEIQQDFKLIPVIYLRNRMSDKIFQYAKGLPHVIDEKQYGTSDYIKSKSKVEITYDMFEQLSDYVNEVHPKLMKKYSCNYASGTADIVSVRNKPEWNHYIFLNQYGRILSDQTFNNHLKVYFKKAGIYIDTDVRENNLAHRFRHGFAMFHAKYSNHPCDALKLQKMMRHKSITSTMVYYNPTPEDELEIKTEFQEELYDMIPELKEDWHERTDL